MLTKISSGKIMPLVAQPMNSSGGAAMIRMRGRSASTVGTRGPTGRP
ncbi:hypothetical protein ACFQV8_10635 [Pseudonocardia benzenivorans]